MQENTPHASDVPHSVSDCALELRISGMGHWRQSLEGYAINGKLVLFFSPDG